MMMKNLKLKKQSQNLSEKNKKSSKKLKVWEELASFSQLIFSIFPPFFFNINTNINIKIPKNFNINIKINILKL